MRKKVRCNARKADCQLVAEEDFVGDKVPATAVALRTVKVWPNIASELRTENPTICSRGDIPKIYVGNTWNLVAHFEEGTEAEGI
jgi:hypothetical protein